MKANDLRLLAAKAVLWWRSRPAPAIRRIRIPSAGPGTAPPAVAGALLRVAVAQVRARLYESALDFALRMEEFVREASARGAELIVLPEDNGTQLLGMLPGAADLDLGNLDRAGAPALEPAAVVRFVSPYLRRAYLGILSELAGSYRRFIVGGSLRTMAADGRPVNEAFCFGPGGEILGSQEKLHLLREEEEWGFVPGRSLTVIDGRGFRLALPVCHDASYFETFRLALARGVDVVAVPAANPEEYNEWYARRGIWARVQETPVYGLVSHLVGEFLGLRLTGRSGVFAPLDLTPAGDGVIARAAGHDTEELVVADLDLAALRAWRAAGLRPAVPAEVVLRYLPGLYAAAGRRGAEAGDPIAEERSGQEPAGLEAEEDLTLAENGRENGESGLEPEDVPAGQGEVPPAPDGEERKAPDDSPAQLEADASGPEAIPEEEPGDAGGDDGEGARASAEAQKDEEVDQPGPLSDGGTD